MKKLLFIAVIAAASLASCKKDRTCTCIANDGTTDVVTYTKSKKGDARANCLSYTTVKNSNTETWTCTLK